MAIAPVTLLDSFGRTASGTWGNMPRGQAWLSSTNSRFNVSGGSATFHSYAGDGRYNPYVSLSSNGIAEQGTCEALMLVKWDSSSSAPLTDFGPMLRRTGSGTFYAVALQDVYDECALIAYVNGVRYELNRAPCLVSKGNWYWIRFQITDSLRVRVWRRDTVEPSSWTTISGQFDGSFPPGAGSPGMFFQGSTDDYTVSMDQYYFYTMEDERPGLPVDEVFSYPVDSGWGISRTNHVWEGNMSVDPSIRTRPREGSVIDTTRSYAQILTSDDQEHYGFIGPSITSNIENYTEFSINSSQGQTQLYIGLYGTMSVSSGVCQGYGYAVKITSGATTLPIMKRTSVGGAWTQVGTAGTITALTANTIYRVRFQKVGTTLQARIWVDGTTEPSTWNSTGTDSSLTSGRMWFLVTQNTGVTTTRTIQLYHVVYQTPTPSTSTYTTVGNVTGTTTDSTIAVTAAFTNDTNANNSLSVRYKKTSDPSFTTYAGTITRGASAFTFTISGLSPNTQYTVETTINDSDSVVGTNPTTTNFTTTNNGVTTGTVTLTDVQATSASLQATYSSDNDNTSTATVDYRTTSSEITLISDTFTDLNDTILSDHIPEVGDVWVRHPGSSSTAYLKINTNRVYEESTAAGQVGIYYNNSAPPVAEYDVVADFFANAHGGAVGVFGRCSTTATTCYMARYSYADRRWELARFNAGVLTVLASLSAELDLDHSYNIRLVIKDAYKSFELDGVEILRSTDNTITGAGVAGIRFASTNVSSYDNQYLLNSFSVVYRSTNASWVSAGAMTVNRSTKVFTKTVSGLSQDTIYELRVTYADASGVYGANPQSVTVMTIGQAVQLNAITTTPQQTSAVVDTFYLYDTNDNSSLDVQYRSTRELLWTTLPATQIAADRANKKFIAFLPSLRAATTYEVQVTISDPNGLVEGSSASLSSLFTTLGYHEQDEKRDKHYLWKVYDVDGNYITTWNDAGTPEFAWHENGGVSDLSVTLARPISNIHTPLSGLAFKNRVDIWCLDPSSDGMGPNLIEDGEFDLGAWTLGSNASIQATAGPDGSSALQISAMVSPYSTQTTRSEAIFVTAFVPFVFKAIARAAGSKLTMYVEAYDVQDNKIDESDERAETVGSEWQTLRLEYIPPADTYYMKIAVENDAKGIMYLDKVSVRPKELLIYRGEIESFTPKLDANGEEIDVEILGLVSSLSDDYIEFLQFVSVQPSNDVQAGRVNNGPADPADMLKEVIDQARRQNPRFQLYYTNESIRNTGNIMEYTFRDQQLRACFDKIVALCPANWHYYVEPDGLVVLRGAEHGKLFTLRLGVEIMNFSVEKSIRNLKNYVFVKGRQDDDNSEPDGNGSITYTAFDQESIDKYGKRMLYIRDAQITDPTTAEFVGNGRLEEANREEQRVECTIPDEKSVTFTGHALRGANIEEFRPGDQVIIIDPIAGPEKTYWDQMIWDQDTWDAKNTFTPLPDPVPIKTVQFEDTSASLELSERRPSSVGDFGRLFRWLQVKESDTND